MRRRAILAIAILAMAGAGWWWWWQSRTPPVTEWQGYAEADFVKVSPVFEGTLTSLYVERGAKVDCGAPLFGQDDASERDALDQATRQLTQAERQLTNLQSASKPTEIEQAEANLAQAKADRDKTQSDLQRYESLLPRAIQAQLVDQTRDNLRAANARVEGLEAALAQMRGPFGREPQIRAQQAAVGAARAAVEIAQWRFDQRHVKAPAAGVIADVLARPGETIPAGVPVVSLLPPENIFVRFFVPEPMLAEVHYGEKVKLICDNCPPDLTATISFISPQAEYTPPVIYSESSRAKLVYRVEARPTAQQAPLLNPGEPAVVRPAAKDRSR